MPCVHAWRQEGREEKSPVEEFHARPFFFLSAQVSFHCVGWLQGWKNIEKFKRNHAYPWAVPACSRQARNNPRKAHKKRGFSMWEREENFPIGMQAIKTGPCKELCEYNNGSQTVLGGSNCPGWPRKKPWIFEKEIRLWFCLHGFERDENVFAHQIW